MAELRKGRKGIQRPTEPPKYGGHQLNQIAVDEAWIDWVEKELRFYQRRYKNQQKELAFKDRQKLRLLEALYHTEEAGWTYTG